MPLHDAIIKKAPASVNWSRALKHKETYKRVKPLTAPLFSIFGRKTRGELSTRPRQEGGVGGDAIRRWLMVIIVAICLFGFSCSEAKASDGLELKSDFNSGIAAALLVCTSLLCGATFTFLNHYRITREQLKSERQVAILVQRRSIAAFKFPPWLRILGDLFFKVGATVIIYGLTSAGNFGLVVVGLVATFVLLAVQCLLVIKWTLHPKSVFHRRHVFFKKDPTFIRIRLFFELFRRFTSFVVVFTFVSYAMHRLGIANFETTQSVPLFLLHLKSNLSGITSLGSAVMAPLNTGAVCFEICRTGFTAIFIFLFLNIVANGFASQGSRPRIVEKYCDGAFGEIANLKSPKPVRADVFALVRLNIVFVLGIQPSEIKEESRLIEDLGADSLELVELQAELETVFETGPISDEEIGTTRLVKDLVDLFMKRLDKDTAKAQAVDKQHSTKTEKPE